MTGTLDRFDAERRPLRPETREPGGIRIDWQADGTGRATFAGVRLQIAPEGLRDPYAARGWRGLRCHCRGGKPPEPVEPWADPRRGAGA
jgi:hypothetical protein